MPLKNEDTVWNWSAIGKKVHARLSSSNIKSWVTLLCLAYNGYNINTLLFIEIRSFSSGFLFCFVFLIGKCLT